LLGINWLLRSVDIGVSKLLIRSNWLFRSVDTGKSKLPRSVRLTKLQLSVRTCEMSRSVMLIKLQMGVRMRLCVMLCVRMLHVGIEYVRAAPGCTQGGNGKWDAELSWTRGLAGSGRLC